MSDIVVFVVLPGEEYDIGKMRKWKAHYRYRQNKPFWIDAQHSSEWNGSLSHWHAW